MAGGEEAKGKRHDVGGWVERVGSTGIQRLGKKAGSRRVVDGNEGSGDGQESNQGGINFFLAVV